MTTLSIIYSEWNGKTPNKISVRRFKAHVSILLLLPFPSDNVQTGMMWQSIQKHDQKANTQKAVKIEDFRCARK